MKFCVFLAILAVAIPFLLISCGATPTPPTTYTVSVLVTGLNGSGLVLQDNGGDNLAIASSGSFTFATAIVSGSAYNVTVQTQPSTPAQTCVASNPQGTVNNVVVVLLACTDNTFTIGVTVSGLSGTGLVLQDNGADSLTITGNGNFTFATAIARGSTYNVTVGTQPASQTCTVTNGYGTASISNITGILVTCYTTTTTYTIGGSVSGLSGTGFILEQNGGNNLAVSANGSFVFTTPVPSGSPFSVTVLTEPSSPAQNCSVTGGQGTATTNISSVVVTCVNLPYSVGGTITNLTASGLVLQDNGGDALSIASGATTFTFVTPVTGGATYAVTVKTQPTGANCAITNGSGTMPNAPLTSVAINCASTSYNIRVTVSGLHSGTSVVLQDNSTDSLTVSANGVPTNFNTPIANSAAYAVSVQTPPAGETCTLGTNASGTVASADVNVAVSCGIIVAAGNANSCVITSGGGVSCWGLNSLGQLGNGTTVNSATPVSVTGLPSAAVSIAAAGDSTCTLTSGGHVWCWGNNSSGQLGNGTFVASSIPVQVLSASGSAPLSGVAAISVGENHACAVTAAGAALCWGDNSKGQLGNGTSAASNLPVRVQGLTYEVSTIAAGSYFSCAATTDGGASCWGAGTAGQLGNGAVADSAAPSSILNATGSAPLSGVVTISAGDQSACALKRDGTVDCWGANNAGQLSNAAAGAQSDLPTQTFDATAQSPLTGVTAISISQNQICAVTTTGAAICWGTNINSQAGSGAAANSGAPVTVSGFVAEAIAAGTSHTCAVSKSGAVLCWGLNSSGQLGNGNTAPSAAPVKAAVTASSGSPQ